MNSTPNLPNHRPDEDARRAYWSSQLEAGAEFMLRTLSYPVEECGERLVSLPEAVRADNLDVAFSTRQHTPGSERIFFLRQGQIDGFLGVCREMNQRGWVMKVEDGFRTRAMQGNILRQPAMFDTVLRKVIWELHGKTPSPEFFLRRSMALIALLPKVGTHMSGSAIDMSVLERTTRTEVDRGAVYLETSECTPMASPFISAAAQANRTAITALMRRHGFAEYPYEFWHFSGGDAYDQLLNNTGRPARYGAIDWSGPADNRITPIANPQEPLHSPEQIRIAIEAALKRLTA